MLAEFRMCVSSTRLQFEGEYLISGENIAHNCSTQAWSCQILQIKEPFNL
jgi:hypothetical protein